MSKTLAWILRYHEVAAIVREKTAGRRTVGSKPYFIIVYFDEGLSISLLKLISLVPPPFHFTRSKNTATQLTISPGIPLVPPCFMGSPFS